MGALARYKKLLTAPALYSKNTDRNYPYIDNTIRQIYKYLQEGKYGGYRVDVCDNNRGLIYIDPSLTVQEQYDTTVKILTELYIGKVSLGIINDLINNGVLDKTSIDTKSNMSSIAVEVLSAPDAADAIWDHINKNKEPVVVVIDSNKQDDYGKYDSTKNTPDPISGKIPDPTLHYILVRGIRENGSTRYFSVYDQWGHIDSATNPVVANEKPIEHEEKDLVALMALPANTPAWLFAYWTGKHPNTTDLPAFILKVNG